MSTEDRKTELAAAVAAEVAARQLAELLERQKLLGDPRVRVQVPTHTEASQQENSFSMSRRYTLG
jgi:hypothetical protein